MLTIKSKWSNPCLLSEQLTILVDKVGQNIVFVRDKQIFYPYKIFLKHVSVFYEFTGTINYWFLTKQNADTILVIL